MLVSRRDAGLRPGRHAAGRLPDPGAHGADVPLAGVTVTATLGSGQSGPVVAVPTDANGQRPADPAPRHLVVVDHRCRRRHGGRDRPGTARRLLRRASTWRVGTAAITADDPPGRAVRLGQRHRQRPGQPGGHGRADLPASVVSITTSRGTVTAQTDANGAYSFPATSPSTSPPPRRTSISVDATSGYADYGPAAGIPDLPMAPATTIPVIVVGRRPAAVDRRGPRRGGRLAAAAGRRRHRRR